MMNSEIRDQAYQFFIEEASELLQTIETGLLTLRDDRSPAKVHEIMRAAHSLKGGAASVELDEIRTLAHRLEDFFRAFYKDDVDLDGELENLLLQGFDCLKHPLMEQIAKGHFDRENALVNAEPIFQRIRERLGDALEGSQEYLPSSEDLGIDITSSIFEVDVAAELERLEAIVLNGTGDVAGELRATAEIFTGFSEMLNLSGFGEIGQVVIDLLDRYPDRAPSIAPVALQNWHYARSLVLAGDRETGGSPSPELLALDNPPASLTLDTEFLQQAYQFFIEEAEELLPIIETGLLSLRNEPTPHKIHEIMRAAHSIKGGAASVGLEVIRPLAYQLEKYFRSLAHPSVEFTPELESDLLEGFDCLKNPLVARIQEEPFDESTALENAADIFARIETRLGEALGQSEEYLPSSTDLGIDIIASIFEIDVAQQLDTLETAIASQNRAEITAILQTTLEVFDGFAQMLNLSGFGEICTCARSCVEYHPDQVNEIASIVLRDFRQARELVLAGDRVAGGTPSPELSILAFPAPITDDRERLEMAESSLAEVFSFDLEPPIESSPALNSYALFDEFFSVQPSDEPLPKSLHEPLHEALPEPFPEPLPEPLPELFPELLSELLPEPLPEPLNVEDSVMLPLDEVSTAVPEPTPSEEAFVFSESDLEAIFGAIEAPLSLPSDSIEPVANPSKEDHLARETSAITKDFDRLPIVESLPQNIIPRPPIPLSTTTQTTRKRGRSGDKTAGKNTASTAAALSVRVDFNRLERMNNLVGELSINRNSLSLQNDQLQAAVKELLTRFDRFEKMTDGIQELSDRLLLAEGTLSAHTDGVPKASWPGQGESDTDDPSADVRFDTLEMDRYGQLHSQLQGLLEEMLQLGESVDDIVLFARGSNQTIETQRQMLTNLRDELMWARMLPLGEVLNRFPRVLRDLCNTYHKSVRLKITGTGVLVDKAALEKLYDPLLHLLRNAFDHGIESPQARREQGKSEEGQIEIRAYHQGNQTIIEIIDDGQGLNLEKIRSKAASTGLMTAEQLAVLPPERLAELIFEPGFSTADKVSELSGRGVGLDVVRDQLRSVKGTVSVLFTPGQGTVFTLRLPLTLTIAKLLICTLNPSNDQSKTTTAVALPSDAIEEIVVPRSEQIKTSGQHRFLYFADRIVPIYPLGTLLEYRCSTPETLSQKSLAASVPSPEEWGLPLLLLRRGQQLVALEVDRLVMEQELVIKPFGSAIDPPAYTYGCTILGDGTLLPVINGMILLEHQEEMTTSTESFDRSIPTQRSEAANPDRTPTILIVDDSAALRRTLALTLQKSGYRVLQARDGREALEQLHQSKGVQLVICDVEMPNMNGFEFLGQRRKFPDLLPIPVAMLTSRGNDKHRQLATQLGANAYFTKPYIEQQFLAAVRDLVDKRSMVKR